MGICAGLIGYGYWGKILTKYLDENTDIDLKYIFSLENETEKRWTGKLSDIWTDHEVQAVFVVTPIETHYALVKEALQCGKDVFCEKPLATKITHAKELKGLAEANQLRLVTDLTYTFSPALGLAKFYLGSDCIGKLQHVELAFKKMGNHSGDDVRWVLGPHLVSILGMFHSLDRLQFECETYSRINGKAESCSITIKDSCITGRIDLSANYPENCREVVLYGEKGVLIYRPGGEEWTLRLLQYSTATKTSTKILAQDVTDIYTDERNNLRYAVRFFVDVFSSRRGDNIDDAIQVTNVLEQLVQE
jgi:predicted dehydrogenase